MNSSTILWRWQDRSGLESARLFPQDLLWILTGTAVFVDNELPCRLDYYITCDASWKTRSARVAGWLGEREIDIDLAVDSSQRWWANGVEIKFVAGCIDLDLNFSPSTNLLPIRRLNLEISQSAKVHAAWLRFPSFDLEPLDQVYTRTGPTSYRYESASGSFRAELTVNESGLITDYPPIWAKIV